MSEIKTIVGSGVIRQLPEVVKDCCGTKIFVLADKNTDRAAGQGTQIASE